MWPLKNFRPLSSCITFSIFIIVVRGSPFHANFQDHSSDIYDSRFEETSTGDVYRLPNDVIPVSYELKMAPNLKDFTFIGQVNITVHVRFATNRIILHSKSLTIQDVLILGAEGSSGNATISIPTKHSLDDKNQIIIIERTSDKFKSGSKYKVSIKFNGTLEIYERSYFTPLPEGFYRVPYEINNETRWVATTQFEATSARRAFPCFDEFRFRAPFTIYLARSQDHIAISNMPSETANLLPADSMSNGLGYEKFQSTPPMPAYLVAFMVSDFKILQDPTLDPRIRVIARPNAIKKGSYALQQATKLLAFLEGHLGVPYPLPKLDLVAVPRYGGGMENWGMTVYGEHYSILENDNDDQQKIGITEVVAHELAHLWFGDLVTPAWFDYLWLKEGFAAYFQYLAADGVELTSNRENYLVNVEMKSSFATDKSSVRALTWPIRKPDEVSIYFAYDSSIIYNKGAILIRMFEHMVSSKTFQSALRRYLQDVQQNHRGVAVPENLFDAFDKQVELDSVSHLPPQVHVSDIMATWSENIGYPLITVTRNYEQGEVKVTQAPYPRKSRTPDDQYLEQKWIVPLTFTTKSQPQFSDILTTHWSFADKSTKLTGIKHSDWILFNLKRSAYYRVNYDSENWKLIIDQLIEDRTKIHEINRAQLVDDASALAKDGLISNETIRHLEKYLRNETSIMVWYPASQWFLEMISAATNYALEQTLKNKLKAFLEAPFKNIGCESSTDDQLARTAKKQFSRLLAAVGINDCSKKFLKMYQKHYNNLSKIPPNLKSAVFCHALRYSDNPGKNFQHLWHNYLKSDQMYEKKRILESIFSCVNDKEVIKSILSKMIDPENKEISQHDLSLISKEFAPSEKQTVTATVEFIDEKMSTLGNLDENCIKFLASLLHLIDSEIRTEKQMELIKKLEVKFASLDQKKYSEYAKMVKNLRINAEEQITYHTNSMKRFSYESFLWDETLAV
ncbi:aminopeptidase N-like [Planococcus citri]|uniref:aminopeptidase N-like n=1 Tax=Planococcus citri TaxID=170843 RepID=UPI0031F8C87D